MSQAAEDTVCQAHTEEETQEIVIDEAASINFILKDGEQFVAQQLVLFDQCRETKDGGNNCDHGAGHCCVLLLNTKLAPIRAAAEDLQKATKSERLENMISAVDEIKKVVAELLVTCKVRGFYWLLHSHIGLIVCISSVLPLLELTPKMRRHGIKYLRAVA